MGTKRGLWCFDFDALADELAIWGGGESDASFQRIEFILVPCNYLHTQYGYEGDSIHKECNHSLEAQQEYLGNIKMFFLTEEYVFNQDKFDDEAVVKRTRQFYKQVDNLKPNWLSGDMLTNVLED